MKKSKKIAESSKHAMLFTAGITNFFIPLKSGLKKQGNTYPSLIDKFVETTTLAQYGLYPHLAIFLISNCNLTNHEPGFPWYVTKTSRIQAESNHSR